MEDKFGEKGRLFIGMWKKTQFIAAPQKCGPGLFHT